ncbi:LysR family transcriptional regulator [Novosphingobium sp. FGD1]|jgi:DNA-binding transcriptional LysR family regulator|uniref:LysR family transcriptional regulator n=1 Tax=Novosphingobium silvae TaxID=2692619 RepID=A0A7X4GD77_9SPHN|nr:LysR family transcriptional regulator [Novosphingobium silvae]MYL96478.1 LysR family transcriptional regulator [Novosphingobium silvae]
MIPSLSPNLLLVLAMLLKTKSVSGTALMLGTSQPSISRSLAKLREALNDPLLVRSGAGMIRTHRGDELVGKLADWVATTSSLLTERTFDPAGVERRFRIASTDFGVMAVILPALAALREEAPGIAIDVLPLNHATHRSLAQGDIDIAISGLEHDASQMHQLHLFRDSFVCVTRPGHPLAVEDGPVSLDAFLAHPHLGLTVSDAELDRVAMVLGPAAEGRRVAASVPYFALAPDLLLAGDLVMVVPSRALQGFARGNALSARPAPEEIGKLDYWLLWHERSQRDPASAWLRERLNAACMVPAE